MSDEGVRVRIVSDGTPQGTRVETERGEVIKGVQRVEWALEVGGFATATIDVLAVAVDVVGLVEGEQSMPEDPTARPLLALRQDPPEGPGFSVPKGDDCG